MYPGKDHKQASEHDVKPMTIYTEKEKNTQIILKQNQTHKL